MYFHCTTGADEETFLQMHGFHLLGGQLHQHMATRHLVEACFTMVLGKPVSLDDEYVCYELVIFTHYANYT